MENKKDFNELADNESIERTISALNANGMTAELVNNGEEAKKKVLSMIPEASEVMNMTSATLEKLGLDKELTSDKYNSVRRKLMSIDRKTQSQEVFKVLKKSGSSPDYAIGSVQAITEDGKVLMASATGSQLPAYVYGANKVIWVVGVNKIVKNIEEAMNRLEKHVFPLENERVKKAYNIPGSSINKILILQKETVKDRIHIILVKESLGF